jgi:hypothetical protein
MRQVSEEKPTFGCLQPIPPRRTRSGLSRMKPKIRLMLDRADEVIE